MDAKEVAAVVSKLEGQCPLVVPGGAMICPRCGQESEFIDPLSIVPKYAVWLTSVRKCPNCYHVFALLTDAAGQFLSLYAHLTATAAMGAG